MKNILIIATIVIACFACQQDKHAEQRGTESKEQVQTGQNEKVDLTSVRFTAKNGEVIFDENGLPSTAIYIYPSNREDSLFLTEDVGIHILKKERYEDFDIPQEAVLGIRAYYAGGGNHYYAVAEGNQLIVYQTYIPEMTPANEDDFPETFEYKRFKTFTFFEDKVVSLSAI